MLKTNRLLLRPHFFTLLNPLLISVFPAVDLFKSSNPLILGASVIKVLPRSLVLVSRKPLESLVKPAVFCKGLIFFTLSVLSRRMLSLRLEPGRALISGRKDYEDFINDYVVF